MKRHMNVFDIDLRVRLRKWWEFNGLIIDRVDYEWLKDQAVKVPGLSGRVETLQREAEKAAERNSLASEQREKQGEELAELKDKHQLALNVLEDHGLSSVYQQRIADLRARKRAFAERRLDV